MKGPEDKIGMYSDESKDNSVARSPKFRAFKESIIGRNKEEFSIVKLREAFVSGLITQEEYFSLLEVYVVQLEEDKNYLETKVGIDALTGLPDRLFLNSTIDKFSKELNINRREYRASIVTSLVVITVDLRGLKGFNEYGQYVGDMAIRAFAERLKTVISRDTDKVFRTGGDEFTLVLPIYNTTPTFDFAKRFEEIYEKANTDLSIDIEVPDQNSKSVQKINLPIRCYMGYTTALKGDGKSADTLLKESNIEMAKNKSHTKGIKSPLDA